MLVFNFSSLLLKPETNHSNLWKLINRLFTIVKLQSRRGLSHPLDTSSYPRIENIGCSNDERLVDMCCHALSIRWTFIILVIQFYKNNTHSRLDMMAFVVAVLNSLPVAVDQWLECRPSAEHGFISSRVLGFFPTWPMVLNRVPQRSAFLWIGAKVKEMNLAVLPVAKQD